MCHSNCSCSWKGAGHPVTPGYPQRRGPRPGAIGGENQPPAGWPSWKSSAATAAKLPVSQQGRSSPVRRTGDRSATTASRLLRCRPDLNRGQLQRRHGCRLAGTGRRARQPTGLPHRHRWLGRAVRQGGCLDPAQPAVAASMLIFIDAADALVSGPSLVLAHGLIGAVVALPCFWPLIVPLG